MNGGATTSRCRSLIVIMCVIGYKGKLRDRLLETIYQRLSKLDFAKMLSLPFIVISKLLSDVQTALIFNYYKKTK
jgi:hypothetical protein